MRKIAFILTFAVLLSIIMSTEASWAYVANPFYAIESFSEYKEVAGYFEGSTGSIYFQWARIARNAEGKMAFTNIYGKSISVHDKWTEYGFPGAASLEDYRNRCPEGKAYLSVFLGYASYSDGKNSIVEFLNMNNAEWKKFVIDPLIKMLDELGFDGAVLDFEGIKNNYSLSNYPDEQKSNLREKYNSFLQRLRDSLGEKLLAVCVHPPNVAGYYDGYDYKFISSISDFMIIMAYDYQYALQYANEDGVPDELVGKIKSVGIFETQPYNKIEECIEKIVSQFEVDANKMILGLDLTGMKWIRLEKIIDGKSYTYYQLERPYLDDIEALEAKEQLIARSKTCKKVLAGDGILAKDRNRYEKDGSFVQQVEYYYESPRTISDKYYTIVSKYKLAGVSVWRLGVGSKSVWRNLANTFKAQQAIFSDVKESDWFYQSLNLLASKGIVNGNPDGTFKPREKVYVDAFIKMMVASLGYNNISNSKGYWASNYISKALELGLVEDGEFAAYNRPISRGEMARIIVRALKEDYDGNIGQYSALIKDYDLIDPKLQEYVLKAYSKGIITGLPGGEFGPQLAAERAQAVTMIARMLDPGLRKEPVLINTVRIP